MLHPIHTFIHRVGRLVLLDRAADPAANGEVQRNATHVKVYSGGAVRSLSDLHTQLHATDHQPAGADAMAVDAAAATGSLRTIGTGAQAAAAGNHTHAASAVSRPGGNTTEATTTSTTAVDLASVASLSIATDTPINLMLMMRRTTGGAAAVGLGLTLNTTVVAEASTTTTGIGRTGTVDEASSRYLWVLMGPRITNYNVQSSGVGLHAGLNIAAVSTGSAPTVTAAQPIATVTTIVIRGISSTGVTCGTDETNIFTYITA